MYRTLTSLVLGSLLLANPAIAAEPGADRAARLAEPGEAAQPAQQTAADESRAFARSLSAAFRNAAERIGPSVVHITTEQDRVVRDIFGRAFRRTHRNLGSGVVVSADGHILTNAHVIADADRLLVRFNDGQEIPAEVIGHDRGTDIAVLLIDPERLEGPLVPAEFAAAGRPEVGDWVLAVGSPFGLAQTVTAGIVSAVERTGIVGVSDDSYEDFIQTDAAINPGNSGGPLVNLDGEVVGINTAIFTRSGDSAGLGFAIPADLARGVMRTLIDHGRIRRGWLGIETDNVPDQMIRRLRIRETGGALLRAVREGSPADEAGLQAGDIVIRFDGRPVRNARGLLGLIRVAGPGAEAKVELLRDGEPLTLTAEVADADRWLAERFGVTASQELGLVVETLSRDILARLGYDPDLGVEGVVVREVLRNSPASSAGLRRGDIIYAIDREIIADEEDFVERASRADPADGVLLHLIRDGRRGQVVLRR